MTKRLHCLLMRAGRRAKGILGLINSGEKRLVFSTHIITKIIVNIWLDRDWNWQWELIEEDWWGRELVSPGLYIYINRWWKLE